jgi:tetratricopeptide (TPR) repeat protein
MTNIILQSRSLVVTPGLLFLVLFIAACSSAPRSPDRGQLDQAIGLYVTGDYAGALERLEALADKEKNESLQIETQLYLGRTYLALEDYNRAIDTFRAGKALGGGVVFDEFLLRLDQVVSGAPGPIAASMQINRSQMASLVDRMFFTDMADIGGQPIAGSTVAAKELRRKVLPLLPDGDFHSEDLVTRASFYAVVARLLDVFSIGDKPASFFDGGYLWVFTQEAVREGKPAYVSGRDAVSVLEKVAEARGNNGG